MLTPIATGCYAESLSENSHPIPVRLFARVEPTRSSAKYFSKALYRRLTLLLPHDSASLCEGVLLMESFFPL